MTAIAAWCKGLERQPYFWDSQVRFWSLLGLSFALLAFTYYVGARRGFQGPPDPYLEMRECLLIAVLGWAMMGFFVFVRSRRRDLLPATAWRIVPLRVGVGGLLAIAAVACAGTVPALVSAFARSDSLVMFEILGGMVLVAALVFTFLTPFYYVRAIAHSAGSDRGPAALPPASSLQPPA